MRHNNPSIEEQLKSKSEELAAITRVLHNLLLEQDELFEEQERQRVDRVSEDNAVPPIVLATSAHCVPTPTATPVRASDTRERRRPLQIGDTIKVTSRYKGRRGTKGTIVGYRGKTQFVIDPTDGSERFYIWKSNVRRVRK